MSSKRDRPLLEAFGLVLVALALVLVSPGALLVFGIDRVLALGLESSQMWTFAAAASAGGTVACAWLSRNVANGLLRYLTGALCVAGFVVVSRWGFRAAWVSDLFSAFAP